MGRIKGLENNIWKFTVHASTNKRAYMTFLTIFLLTMPNATAKTIGLLTLVGQIAGFIFEIPSGYISDRIGHKKALIIARTAMALSTFVYIFADSTAWFFVGAILLAIGWAFISGTSSAFMQDTLSALGKGDRYAQIMGKVKSIGFAIPIIFILLLAFVAEENFRLAFSIAFVIDILGLIAVLLLENPPVAESATGEVAPENFISTLKTFIHIPWIPYVASGVLFVGILLGSTIGFKNPYQELLGFSIGMLGILWAISRGAISLLLLINGTIHKLLTFKQFILLEAGIVASSFLIIGITTNKWVIALFFIIANTSLWGLSSVRAQYFLSFIKYSPIKATLLSMKELLNKVVIGVTGLIMGMLVINISFQNAYLISGFAFVLLAVGIILFVPKFDEKN